MEKEIRNLMEYITSSPSPWHGAQTASDRLAEAGFQRLDWLDKWKLTTGGKYYVPVYGGLVFAFTLGRGKLTKDKALRIAAAHTDFPGFRIKPQAGMVVDGYGSLNVESYGGAILYSWLDRPLTAAGRVALKGRKAFNPTMKLVDFARPLMTIPSLAIHMNKKVNEGMAFNRQKDMLPLVATLEKDHGKEFFDELLAEELGVKREDILAYELNLAPFETPCCIGRKEELISSPRLDNCTSVTACLAGILAGQNKGLNIIALFDNEEVGSRSKQGAGSANLMQLLERIYEVMGYNREEMWLGINNGFMLSVDVAHGLHPNYPDKTDPTNKARLNGGVVIKQAASQSYASDAEGVAMVKGLCQAGGIPYQQFVNRADMPGGATLGSIASALVPMLTMDVGVPILAMHSARETMGAADQLALCRLIKTFFQY